MSSKMRLVLLEEDFSIFQMYLDKSHKVNSYNSDESDTQMIHGQKKRANIVIDMIFSA